MQAPRGGSMAIVSAAALVGGGLIAAALLFARSTAGAGRAESPAPPLASRDDLEAELLERRAEIARIEERVITKEEAIDLKLADLGRREQTLDDRGRELDRPREEPEARKRDHLRELERIANLSAGQAKQLLLKEVEDRARHDAARVLRQVEEVTKREAERRV